MFREKRSTLYKVQNITCTLSLLDQDRHSTPLPILCSMDPHLASSSSEGIVVADFDAIIAQPCFALYLVRFTTNAFTVVNGRRHNSDDSYFLQGHGTNTPSSVEHPAFHRHLPLRTCSCPQQQIDFTPRTTPIYSPDPTSSSPELVPAIPISPPRSAFRFVTEWLQEAPEGSPTNPIVID